MRLFIVIFCVVTLLFQTLRAEVESKEKFAGVRETMQQWAGKKEIGIVVGLVSAKETNIISSSDAFNGDSVFEIASLTKLFTGTLLAKMVEEEKVKLSDPAQNYLPKSVKIPQRDGKQITLQDLSTHMSGLPRMPKNFGGGDSRNPYANYTLAKMYAFLSGYKLPRDIGEKYEYSNLAVALLGQILAKEAGTNYESLIRARVCLPLQMTNTSITLSDWQRVRLAKGHNSKNEPTPNWDLAVFAGAGGLRSTVNDMVKFVSANLALTKNPLSNAIETAQMTRTKTDQTGMEMGLGWHVRKRNGRDLFVHNGQTGGYHSFIALDKENHKGIIVLCNAAANIDEIGFNLLYGRPVKPPVVTSPEAGKSK